MTHVRRECRATGGQQSPIVARARLILVETEISPELPFSWSPLACTRGDSVAAKFCLTQ